MERKKKYIKVKELPKKILDDLVMDAENYNELVSKWYTKTTSGGEGILWQVNDKQEGLHFTVSTRSISQYRVNRCIVVDRYRHYVLTQVGVQYIKEKLMEDI